MNEGTRSKAGRLNGSGGWVYERKSGVGGWIDGCVKVGMTQIELWGGWVDNRNSGDSVGGGGGVWKDGRTDG
jgi:hypothetical protein